MNKQENNERLKSDYSDRLRKIDQQLIEIRGKLVNLQEHFNKSTDEDIKELQINEIDIVNIKLNRINNSLD